MLDRYNNFYKERSASRDKTANIVNKENQENMNLQNSDRALPN